MIKRKQIAGLGLSGILTLMALTGCGSQADTAPAGEASNVSETADTETQTEEQKDGQEQEEEQQTEVHLPM